MFTISRSVCVDASASKVWGVLSNLDSIHVWVESIKRNARKLMPIRSAC